MTKSGSKSSSLEMLDREIFRAGEVCEFRLQITIGAEGVAAGGGFVIYPPVTTVPHVWASVRWRGAVAMSAVVMKTAGMVSHAKRLSRNMGMTVMSASAAVVTRTISVASREAHCGRWRLVVSIVWEFCIICSSHWEVIPIVFSLSADNIARKPSPACRQTLPPNQGRYLSIICIIRWL